MNADNNINRDNSIARTPTSRRRFIRGAAAVGAGAAARAVPRLGPASPARPPSRSPAVTPSTRSAWPRARRSTRSSSTAATASTTSSSPPRSSASIHEGSTAEISPSTQIATELQPRFVGGQPARPDRQLGCPVDRLQRDPRPARGPQRRHRRPQPRGRDDPRHAVRRRACARDIRRQAGRDQLRPHGVRRVVFVRACSRRTAGRRRRPGPRPRSSAPRPRSRTSTCSCWGKEAATYYQTLRHRLGDQGGRRRGPPGAREPRGGLLVASGRAGRVHRAQGDHRPRVHEARRRRHAVHRRPRPSGASTRRRCCTRRARGSRTR